MKTVKLKNLPDAGEYIRLPISESAVILEVEFYRDVEIDHDVLSDSTDIVFTFQVKCFCLIWLFSESATD